LSKEYALSGRIDASKVFFICSFCYESSYIILQIISINVSVSFTSPLGTALDITFYIHLTMSYLPDLLGLAGLVAAAIVGLILTVFFFLRYTNHSEK
jgi:hypothetical protein